MNNKRLFADAFDENLRLDGGRPIGGYVQSKMGVKPVEGKRKIELIRKGAK